MSSVYFLPILTVVVLCLTAKLLEAIVHGLSGAISLWLSRYSEGQPSLFVRIAISLLSLACMSLFSAFLVKETASLLAGQVGSWRLPTPKINIFGS